MQRQRGGLVPIGEASVDLPGPVQALIPSPPTQRHFTLADQVNQLVGASEADPDLGFHGADDGAVFPAPHQPRQPERIQARQRAVDTHHALKQYNQAALRQPASSAVGLGLH